MPQTSLSKTASPPPQFHRLALGGTFDRFHKGHRKFLLEAFTNSLHVIVGITDDRLAAAIHNDSRLEPLSVRRKTLEAFLTARGLSNRAEIITLSDPFGPTIMEKNLDALLLTENTRKAGLEVNRKRQTKGLKPLALVNVLLVLGDDGKEIASRRIRNGEINREGKSYALALFAKTPARVPKLLRQTFREPFGEVFSGSIDEVNGTLKHIRHRLEERRQNPLLFCVGDLVTTSALKIGWLPFLSIIDLKIKRQKRYHHPVGLGFSRNFKLRKVINPQGTITKHLAKSIQAALKGKEPSLILVDGEEDLAVLPCVLLAPLGAMIVYGHFQHGVVAVNVTEKKKSEALSLLNSLPPGR